MLLVHYDVDAICTCRILQGLFKSDNISYTLVPVGGISELKTAYEENNEEIKYVVLVNCGGTLDLVDILQPEEDVVFFVLDAHKPTDVCNVYSDGQVRLINIIHKVRQAWVGTLKVETVLTISWTQKWNELKSLGLEKFLELPRFT